MLGPFAPDEAPWVARIGRDSGRAVGSIWVTIVSAFVLVAVPVWWLTTRPDATFGTPPWDEQAHHARGATRTVSPGEETFPAITVHSARLADLESIHRGRPPLRLGIPALGVDAKIVPLGVEPSGAMEVPEDVATVGWYRFGPAPGAPGSALLAGHVDSREQGAGVFFSLSRLERGDLVRVRTMGTGWRSFEVVSRSLIVKDRLPGAIFARNGAPTLTLITCGGGFDQEAGHYTHNVIVSAVPRT